MRDYLLGITTAALLCAILLTIIQDKKYAALLKLLCSIFMTLSIVRPLLNLRLEDSQFENLFMSAQAQEIVEEGSMAAKEAMAEAVIEQTEAYIIRKAAFYDAEISANVMLEEEELLPVAVEIHGQLSPYARQQLSQWISQELGIDREAQRWEN